MTPKTKIKKLGFVQFYNSSFFINGKLAVFVHPSSKKNIEYYLLEPAHFNIESLIDQGYKEVENIFLRKDKLSEQKAIIINDFAFLLKPLFSPIFNFINPTECVPMNYSERVDKVFNNLNRIMIKELKQAIGNQKVLNMLSQQTSVQNLHLKNGVYEGLVSIRDNQPYLSLSIIKSEKTWQELDFDTRLFEKKIDPKTSFIIGGQNRTDLIKSMQTFSGLSISELEQRTSPGVNLGTSYDGFKGEQESFLDILASDNDFVLSQGNSHQELAEPLLYAVALAEKLSFLSKSCHGNELKGQVIYKFYNHQYLLEWKESNNNIISPFNDGYSSNKYLYITNLTNNKKIGFSGLLPFLIYKYGFYEGIQTCYRLAPSEIIKVF
jgi:hypothetical protein